jgi:hypothetical protein
LVFHYFLPVAEIRLVENNEIPTELTTTKNCEPSEIKLVENNEIPTELTTTKNCEPSEIKLVENNEIPTELKTTKNCVCWYFVIFYQFYFRWLTVLSSF